MSHDRHPINTPQRGSTVTLQRNWHNSGGIVISDASVLNLQGTYSTADLGLSGWLRFG